MNNTANTTPPSFTTILRFWSPLAATWLMMATEGPFLAAVIARLPDPRFNLAAFGVAFAFAIIIEAPVIMMMSASTALVDSPDSYRKLRAFAYWLNGLVTVSMAVVLIGPVYTAITRDLIGLAPEVARLTRGALVIMLPWPAAIGYRRFYQGLLIRNNLTRRVAYGTVLRLVSMCLTGLIGYLLTDLPGAWVGGAALTVGVCVEALASRIMVRGVVAGLRRPERTGGVLAADGVDNADSVDAAGSAPLSYRSIIRFYYPLALTSTISLAVQPVVTFFMGQARFSLESLAVLPVINSLVFIFRTFGLSYQEVVITLLDRSRDNLGQCLRFAGVLMVVVAIGMSAITLTPLSGFWFRTVSGLDTELAAFAMLPARLLVVLPVLSVVLALQRALLVSGRRTDPITWASVLEVAVVAATLIVMIRFFDVVGAVAAACALVLGRLAANGYLIRSVGGVIRALRGG